MTDLSTAEKILQTAIDRFSRYGYHGTSMRDIAKAVPLKESTIYYHFENKQAILKAAYELFRKNILPFFTVTDELIQRVRTADPIPSWTNALETFYEIFEQEWVWKVWLILSNEQYRDREATDILLEFHQAAIDGTVAILEILKEQDRIIDTDLHLLAREFQYTNRAYHLEYIMRKQHGMDTSQIPEWVRQHVEYFFSNIYVK